MEKILLDFSSVTSLVSLPFLSLCYCNNERKDVSMNRGKKGWRQLRGGGEERGKTGWKYLGYIKD